MIFLGKIFKVRSNRGEVVYTSPFDVHEVLKKGERITLKSEKRRMEYLIENVREIKGASILKLAGVDSINDALKLVGYSIYSDNAEVQKEVDDAKEMNMDGFTVQTVTGEHWGTVIHFEETGLNKLLEIQGHEDTFYVPFSEEIVIEIRSKDRVIIIDPPAGLKDLNS